MLSLAELSQALEAYKNGEASLDQFADWYHAASRGKFGERKAILDVCLAIDAAFSRLDYEGISESEFQRELVNAIGPFVRPPVLDRCWNEANMMVLGTSSAVAFLAHRDYGTVLQDSSAYLAASASQLLQPLAVQV